MIKYIWIVLGVLLLCACSVYQYGPPGPRQYQYDRYESVVEYGGGYDLGYRSGGMGGVYAPPPQRVAPPYRYAPRRSYVPPPPGYRRPPAYRRGTAIRPMRPPREVIIIEGNGYDDY